MSPRNQEATHGRALIQWRNAARARTPGLAFLFHVPNGVRLNARRAAMAKAEGLEAGVPDYLLPWASGIWKGCAFELKTPGNYPTPEQRLWLNMLHAQGWLTFVAWHWLAAKDVLERYLDPELSLELSRQGPGPGDWLTQERAGRGARVYPTIREQVPGMEA